MNTVKEIVDCIKELQTDEVKEILLQEWAYQIIDKCVQEAWDSESDDDMFERAQQIKESIK